MFYTAVEQLGENPVAQCRWFETWKPVNYCRSKGNTFCNCSSNFNISFLNAIWAKNKVINHRIEISISSKNTVLENPVISSCLPHRINYMLSDFRYSDISLESFSVNTKTIFDLEAAFWKIICVKILVKLIIIYWVLEAQGLQTPLECLSHFTTSIPTFW